MEEHPDHPHLAAVHLMKALKCCQDCADYSEADFLAIKELEYRKDLLAEQFKSLNGRGDSIVRLREQISELEQLVIDLRSENIEVENLGIEEINRINSQRQMIENGQKESICAEINNQKSLTQQLTLQLQSLLERVKYLNQVNNELMYNICTTG